MFTDFFERAFFIEYSNVESFFLYKRVSLLEVIMNE